MSHAPHFNTRKLVARFGGPTKIPYLLEAHGFPVPSVKAVEKWIERRKIDSNRLAQFVVIADRQGDPINLHNYVERG